MSFIIGLTGPTGAGKSSITKMAEGFGFHVIDCDAVSREAVVKGSEGLAALTAAFGKDILDENLELDRKMLAKKAFATKGNTELLNKTILPYISKIVLSCAKNHDKLILDAPTLFESGLDSICNKTVAVLADRDIRLARILKRDGIEKSAAELRMNAGKSDDFYKNKADIIIFNNGNIQDFTREFEKVILGLFENTL